MDEIEKLNKKQIAERTGLSYSTVMRYFNGTAGVSAANAAKIQSLAGSLPPRKPPRRTAGGVIKIMAAFPSYSGFFWDAATRSFVRKSGEYATGQSLKSNVIRYAFRDCDSFIGIINMLDRLGADGYVIMPKLNANTADRLSEFTQRHPTVFICDTLGSLQALGEVVCDYEKEMRKFAGLITGYGGDARKRILLIGLNGESERHHAMIPMLESCLSEYPNIEVAGVETCETDCPRNLMPSRFARLLEPYAGRIDAVFANDGVTDLLCGALDKLRQGARLSGQFDDISVFGMDASPARMAKYRGRFDGIYSCQNISVQAEAALDILIDNLCGEGKLPKKRVMSFTYNRI